MTADIIHLGSLKHDEPAPAADIPLRCFIYEQRGSFRDYVKKSGYTFKKVRWSVAKAVTSECHELWAVVNWLQRHPGTRGQKEGHQYAIFQMRHDEIDQNVWVLAGRSVRKPDKWVIATRLNLRQHGLCPSLVGIQAEGRFIWVKTEGFQGAWAGVGQSRKRK